MIKQKNNLFLNKESDNKFLESNFFSSDISFNPTELNLDETNTWKDFFCLPKIKSLDNDIITDNHDNTFIEKSINEEKTTGNIINFSLKHTKDEENTQSNKEGIIFKKNNTVHMEELKKNLGHKRKSNNKHNKYSEDNLRRKSKNIIINTALDFLNLKIYQAYNGKIGYGILKKELLPINQSQKADSSIDFNKNLLNKNLEDIFSVDISTKFSNFSSKHNIILIKRLLNENDEEKRQYFKKLFSITFSRCVKSFIGLEKDKDLEGFTKFEDIKYKYMEEPNYLFKLEEHLRNFERLLNDKKNKKNKGEKLNN